MRVRYSVLVALLTVAAASASLASPPTYVRSIGGPGTAPGSLLLPISVAVDAAGDVYVADNTNCRVTRYHADGTYVTHWDARGTVPYDQATGIAVDGDGTVYVALRYGTLAKFDGNGTPLGELTQDAMGKPLAELWGVEAAEGAVYLVDYMAAKLYELQNGALVPIASGSGCGAGQFWSPVSVARVGANLYVTEYSDRLQELGTQGEFVAELGSTATCGQIRGYPRAVCGLGADRLVVVDALNNTAEIVSTTGQVITTWGGQGSGPGQFYGPFDVATDSQGRIYVADAWNQRIQVFDTAAPTPTRPTSWGRLKAVYR